ncbi:DUF3644 domain-containing protein [Variovorax paradoxus]|nr:DUF3644 domain-containing protein [Variovorax paradoxus]
MRPPLHLRFVDKAQAAVTAAVEVYNKPAFAYREETFAILALNAWELLLKGKLLKDAGNAVKALRVYGSRPTKNGAPSKKLYLKTNRAGLPMSISLGACITKLEGTAAKLPAPVRANLDALQSIRDNSVHFVTANATLARQAQELAAASVSNFVLLSKAWFARDFSRMLNLVLPLSFVAPPHEVNAVVVSADETRLIEHLKNLAQEVADGDGDYAVALRMQVKLEKSVLANASKVMLTKDDDAVKVTLSEQDIRERYPWDYSDLCKRLGARYTDFKQNQDFHGVRLPLMTDDKYTKARYLDPGNPRSSKKDFYNSNVLQVFDQHYTKK